jgi:hypothetical protein
MQYTNVYSPKPTYYFYHAICYIKSEHKTVLRERQNAGQLTLGHKILMAQGFSEET